MTDAPAKSEPNESDLTTPELKGLVTLSNREGVDIRPTLLRVITDLYLQKPVHTEQEARQYEKQALKLIEHVDAQTRATIAQKIAGYPNAPAAVRQRLLKDYIRIKSPDEQSKAADKAQPEKRTDSKPAAPGKASADELSELFFTTDAEERRLILLNLSYAPIKPAKPLEPAAAQAAIKRLETAALGHRIEIFARELEQALSISRALAHRVVTDPSGEPIVVAAAALQMPAAVLQRILLCINPVISQSVQRVYDLALLHKELKAESALRMIAIWQRAHRTESDHKPKTTPSEPQRGVEQRRAAFSTVRPKIRWDQHAQSRKADGA